MYRGRDTPNCQNLLHSKGAKIEPEGGGVAPLGPRPDESKRGRRRTKAGKEEYREVVWTIQEDKLTSNKGEISTINNRTSRI
jgi:hypothetical protein